MADNKFKEKMMEMAIENHRTASWANIEKLKNVSRVSLPTDFEVENAKGWVDENQK